MNLKQCVIKPSVDGKKFSLLVSTNGMQHALEVYSGTLQECRIIASAHTQIGFSVTNNIQLD